MEMEFVTTEPEMDEESIFEDIFVEPEGPSLDIKTTLREAQNLFTQGLYDLAIEKLQEIVRIEPQNTEASLLLGKIYRIKKLYGEASDILKRIQGESKEAVKELARVFIDTGDFFNAKMKIESLLEKDPGDVECYKLLAHLAEKEGDYDSAVYTLEKLLRVERSEDVLRELGRLLIEKEEYDKAADYLKEALELGKDVHTYYLLGKIMYLKENFIDSKSYLEEAIKISPDNPDVNKLLAKVQLNLGEFESALKTVEHLKEKISGDSEIYLIEGSIYTRVGDNRAAINSFEKAISLDENNITAYKLLASLLTKTGELEKSIRVWQEIQRRWPDSTVAGEAKQAIDAAKKLIELTGGLGWQ